MTSLRNSLGYRFGTGHILPAVPRGTTDQVSPIRPVVPDAWRRGRAGKSPTGRPLEPGTVHNAVRVMRQVLDAAVRARHLCGNLAHGLTRADLPKAQRDATATPYLSAAQVERLASQWRRSAGSPSWRCWCASSRRRECGRGNVAVCDGRTWTAARPDHRCGVDQCRKERGLVRGPAEEREVPRRPDAASCATPWPTWPTSARRPEPSAPRCTSGPAPRRRTRPTAPPR